MIYISQTSTFSCSKDAPAAFNEDIITRSKVEQLVRTKQLGSLPGERTPPQLSCAGYLMANQHDAAPHHDAVSAAPSAVGSQGSHPAFSTTTIQQASGTMRADTLQGSQPRPTSSRPSRMLTAPRGDPPALVDTSTPDLSQVAHHYRHHRKAKRSRSGSEEDVNILSTPGRYLAHHLVTEPAQAAAVHSTSRQPCKRIRPLRFDQEARELLGNDTPVPSPVCNSEFSQVTRTSSLRASPPVPSTNDTHKSTGLSPEQFDVNTSSLTHVPASRQVTAPPSFCCNGRYRPAVLAPLDISVPDSDPAQPHATPRTMSATPLRTSPPCESSHGTTPMNEVRRRVYCDFSCPAVRFSHGISRLWADHALVHLAKRIPVIFGPHVGVDKDGFPAFKLGGTPYMGSKGTMLGHIEVLLELNTGGFGRVYQGYDHQARKYIAVKVSRSDLKSRAFARRELVMLKLLLQHDPTNQQPWAMPSKTLNLDGQHICVALPLLASSLQDFIGRHGAMSPWQARNAIKQVLGFLKFIHDEGIVHGDIKPGNLMLVCSRLDKQRSRDTGAPVLKRDTLRVIDFGLAFEHERKGRAGTRQYLAPEIVMEATYSTPVDIWATGVSLIQLLTGRILFEPPHGASPAFQTDWGRKDGTNLWLIEQICGRFPSEVQGQIANPERLFQPNGHVRLPTTECVVRIQTLDDILGCIVDGYELYSIWLYDLLRCMFDYDPRTRMTAAQALEHALFQLDQTQFPLHYP